MLLWYFKQGVKYCHIDLIHGGLLYLAQYAYIYSFYSYEVEALDSALQKGGRVPLTKEEEPKHKNHSLDPPFYLADPLPYREYKQNLCLLPQKWVETC